MLGTFRALIEKMKHEILFDNVLLPWCVEWLNIMSNNTHRGIRHTGTEAAIGLMVQLAGLLAELDSSKQSKERLQSGKKNKKDATAVGLAAEIEQLELRGKRTPSRRAAAAQPPCSPASPPCLYGRSGCVGDLALRERLRPPLP